MEKTTWVIQLKDGRNWLDQEELADESHIRRMLPQLRRWGGGDFEYRLVRRVWTASDEVMDV